MYKHRVKEPILLLSTHLHICVPMYFSLIMLQIIYNTLCLPIPSSGQQTLWSGLFSILGNAAAVFWFFFSPLCLLLLCSACQHNHRSSLVLPIITIHLVEALAVGHTLLADFDELHGQLQLPPLWPARCGVDNVSNCFYTTFQISRRYLKSDTTK